MLQKILFLVIFGGFSAGGFSQKSPFYLKVMPKDSIAEGYIVPESFKNKESVGKFIKQLPDQMRSEGYLSASIDSLYYDSSSVTIFLFAGKKYQWDSIIVPMEVKNLVGFNSGSTGVRGKSNQYLPVSEMRESLLTHYEESGYPFATVGFDSIEIVNEKIYGKLLVNKGAPYKIDSISQLGNLRMNSSFIYRYLMLPKGSIYQKSRLLSLDKRLNEMPFAVQSRPWDLSMLGSGGVVNIYLEPKKSNIINVLLGVMPVSTQTPGNKLQVTGDANILLRNSFRVGETIGINWQQIQYKSPRLKMNYEQPYLFGSQAGIDFSFELFKKDTQFVNVQFSLGVPFEFSGSQSAKLFLFNQQTNVTTVDTSYVLQTGRLPDLAASQSTSIGLDYIINTTDQKNNPQKGIEFSFGGLAGLKKINKSSQIVDLKDPNNIGFDYSGLYDSMKLNTYQMKIKARIARYFSLAPSKVLQIAFSGGVYQSGNYFRNELYQIGGFKLLRGFDEESIFAKAYGVATAEYRMLISRNSYFFGFADGGYSRYRDEALVTDNWYIGTGVGMVLEAKNNLINLSWAIGKRNDLPFDLRQSKIHLGFINFF